MYTRSVLTCFANFRLPEKQYSQFAAGPRTLESHHVAGKLLHDSDQDTMWDLESAR